MSGWCIPRNMGCCWILSPFGALGKLAKVGAYLYLELTPPNSKLSGASFGWALPHVNSFNPQAKRMFAFAKCLNTCSLLVLAHGKVDTCCCTSSNSSMAHPLGDTCHLIDVLGFDTWCALFQVLSSSLTTCHISCKALPLGLGAFSLYYAI